MTFFAQRTAPRNKCQARNRCVFATSLYVNMFQSLLELQHIFVENLVSGAIEAPQPPEELGPVGTTPSSEFLEPEQLEASDALVVTGRHRAQPCQAPPCMHTLTHLIMSPNYQSDR